LDPTYWAGSVYVPSQGWVIFGGLLSSLLTAQKLPSIDGKWEAGPPLYQNLIDNQHCLVQVKTKNY
jgi:hypothetical protein